MANAGYEKAVLIDGFCGCSFLICAITEHKTSEATPFN